MGRIGSIGAHCLYWIAVLSSLTCNATDSPVLRFVENKGQWKSDDLFLAEIQHGKIALRHDGFRFYLFGTSERNPKSYDNHLHTDFSESHYPAYDRVHLYDLKFVNANPCLTIQSGGRAITKYNYYYGDDPADWVTAAGGFQFIDYKSVYDGIDLKVYSTGNRLKYEWYVKPTSDANQIILEYVGIDHLSMNENNLKILTSVGEMIELKPYAYQVRNGKRYTVPSQFRIDGKKIRYEFPEGYDECEELVIDPILIFSAYSGSSLDNWGNTATYDSRGNAYSGGIVQTQSPGLHFPVTPGAYQVAHAGGNWDIGILKYDSAGSELLYATFIGGSGIEVPQSLVANSKDELLILGVTGSPNFPVTNSSSFQQGWAIDPLGGLDFINGTDLFAVKLSADGSALLGGTYLGGTHNDGVNFIAGEMDNASSKVESPLGRNYGDQLRGDIITGENDTVFIASSTLSTDFVGRTNTFAGGSHDAIIVKLSPDLNDIIEARFLGGTGTDVAYSIKLKDDKVVVGGGTNSADLPKRETGLMKTAPGGIDGWVAELQRKDLDVVRATYLGTPQYDQVYFIDLNPNGDVYAFGQTRGAYPVQGDVYSDPNAGQFIHKLDNTLTTTLFSTVIGSSNTASTINPNISPTAFLVSECNKSIFLSGWGGILNAPGTGLGMRNYVGGDTHDMPVSPSAFQEETSGNDFYLMVLSDDAKEFTYGTYLGGTVSRTHVDGGTSRFDKQGIVYHAVCAGCGGQSDFPAVNVPAQHQENNSTNCNNAVFKFDLAQLKATIVRPSELCLGDTLKLVDNSTDGILFEWEFGDGTEKTFTTPTDVEHIYKAPGVYDVKFVVSNPNSCSLKDSVMFKITVNNPQVTVQADDRICEGDDYSLQASGGTSYQWRLADGTLISNLSTPSIAPTSDQTYYVTIVGSHGCVVKDKVDIEVVPQIIPAFTLELIGGCFGRPELFYRNLTDSLEATDLVVFNWGDGTATDKMEDVHSYQDDGVYQLTLITTRDFCVWEETKQAPLFQIKVPNVITPESSPGDNDVFHIQFGSDPLQMPLDYGFKTSVRIYNRWGRILFEEDDYRYDWNASELAAGIYYYDVEVEQYSACHSWIQILK